MAYSASQARQQLLDTVAEAIAALGLALAALGLAYEQLDEHSADELESGLFEPVQGAYGRAQRTVRDFAGRHGLPTTPSPAPGSPGAPSIGARGLIERAVEAVGEADHILAELQDSLLPVEVGDPELRAGLTDVRARLGAVPDRARALVRMLGR